MDQLFDVSSRSHKPEPQQDREFLADQRQARRRHIRGIDAETSARWQRREERRTLETAKQTAVATVTSVTADIAASPLVSPCARRRDGLLVSAAMAPL